MQSRSKAQEQMSKLKVLSIKDEKVLIEVDFDYLN